MGHQILTKYLFFYEREKIMKIYRRFKIPTSFFLRIKKEWQLFFGNLKVLTTGRNICEEEMNIIKQTIKNYYYTIVHSKGD